MDTLIDYSLILWVLLVFIIIPLIAQIYVLFISKRKQRIEYLNDLAGYVSDDYNKFIDAHDNYSETKALGAFFSNKDNERKALIIKNEIEQEIKRNSRKVTAEDRQRLKEDIQRRKRDEYLRGEKDFFNDAWTTIKS